MEEYAEEQGIMKKPRRLLISSFSQTKGLFITPLLQFYLKLGLKIGSVYSFIEYEPETAFKSFVEDIVKARRHGDENPESSVVAETMKLIGNSSYGYQIMDRSRHSETVYLNDEKELDKLINKKQFNSLDVIGTVNGNYHFQKLISQS